MYFKWLYILIIFFFLLSGLGVKGGTITEKVDSLKQLLKTAGEDSVKVNTLNELSWEVMITGDYEKAIQYANHAMTLSEELNFTKGKSTAYNNIGIIYECQGNYAKALENHFASLKIKEEAGDKKGMSNSYNNIGLICADRGEYDKALEYYFTALKIREETGDKHGIASSYNNIGIIYWNQGNYDNALEFFFTVLKINEETGDKKGTATSYNNIGLIYAEKNNYAKALENYFASLKIYEEIGDKQSIALSYNNIGSIYGEQGNYDKALENYFASLKIYEEIGDKQGIALSYNNISNASLKQALTYTYPQTGNNPSFRKREELIAEAKKQSLASLNIAKEIGSKDDLRMAYQTLSLCDSIAENWKGAYEYHQLYSGIKDSIFNEESSRQIAEMSTKYETEKKEQQIKLLEKEGELQKSEVRRQKFIIWSVAGGLLIVVVFSFFIFKERKKSEKLLLNILPVETARELKKKGKALPRHYKMATVLFTDFKGFTKIAEKMSVEELVSELDFIFRKFDELISKYPIEKIKTIGDAYMCAGGLPVENTTNPADVVMVALDIQQFVEEYKQQCIKEGKQYFEIRIGVHTGPVVAGVVGDKKFAYDIWGDTVNTASRMESSGEPGKVNISGATCEAIKTTHKFETLDTLIYTYRGKIPAKNKGEIEMWFVEKR